MLADNQEPVRAKRGAQTDSGFYTECQVGVVARVIGKTRMVGYGAGYGQDQDF